MKKIVICLSVLCLMTISCQKMKYGNVTERWFQPEYTTLVFMPMSTGKITIMMPVNIHHDDIWCVKVKGIGVKGDSIIRTYYVNKLAYDTLSIGKFICIEGMCDEDPTVTQSPQ